MALEYTHSPLGLIPYSKITNPESQSEFKYYFRPNQIRNTGGNSGEMTSVFSNKSTLVRYRGGGAKHFGTHPLALGPVADTHNDKIYDVSTKNIIERLNEYPSMRLKWGDFAYCRDYGVYPNNRLIICRRFPSPVVDDLTFAGSLAGVHSKPIVTLISWFDDQTNPLSFNFGEDWGDAGGSFKELLNDVGKEIGMKGQFQLGDILFEGAGIVPLPGVTEGLQRTLLGVLGIIGDNKTESIIPSGTPNLIKESKMRKLIKEDSTGSGLKGSFSVSVKCAWEQKFIAGIDPTIVYYDILQTILSFGGSEAVFYLGKKSNLAGLDKLIEKYLKPGGAADVLKDVISAFQKALIKVKNEIIKFVTEAIDSSSEQQNGGGVLSGIWDAVKGVFSNDQNNNNQQNPETAQAVGGVNKIINSFVHTVLKKYRIQALGVVTTLTGLPSTPWHVTIGNPLRPIFSSGDMYTTDVTVTLGPQLAYNDLPSYIEASFTLTSARNCGIDEIMTKLSCGAVRVTKESPSFWTKNITSEKADDIVKEFQGEDTDDGPQELLPVSENTLPVVDEYGAYEQEVSTVDSASNIEEDIVNTPPITNSQSLVSGVTGQTGGELIGGVSEGNQLPELVVVAQRSQANSGQGAQEQTQSKVGAEPQNNGQVINQQPPDPTQSIQVAAQADKDKNRGGTGPQGSTGATQVQQTQQQSLTGPQGQTETQSSTPTNPPAVREDLKPENNNVTGAQRKGSKKLDWEVGKLIKKGGYFKDNISVKWEVRQSIVPTYFNGFLDGEDLGLESNNLEYVVQITKEEAANEFITQGGELP